MGRTSAIAGADTSGHLLRRHAASTSLYARQLRPDDLKANNQSCLFGTYISASALT